jgi:hypothetical protein
MADIELKKLFVKNHNIRLERLKIQDWDNLTRKICYRILAVFGAAFVTVWSIYVTFGVI